MLTEAPDWNPTDYSVGLTRRARGLPFWFSLATHGTDAYREAVERTLEVTRFADAEIGRRDYLEVVREPDLSVVVFRRIGWSPRSTRSGRTGCSPTSSRSSCRPRTTARR